MTMPLWAVCHPRLTAKYILHICKIWRLELRQFQRCDWGPKIQNRLHDHHHFVNPRLKVRIQHCLPVYKMWELDFSSSIPEIWLEPPKLTTIGSNTVRTDGPHNTLPHSQSPITLYTELDTECDQQVMIISQLLKALGQRLPSPSVVNNRPITVACLSHSVTVDVAWPNCLSLEFGTKFQKVPLFYTIQANWKRVKPDRLFWRN